MADEDWESELDNGPACVPKFSASEPSFEENSKNSFSSNRDFNENFRSADKGFGNQKGDDLNQNFESSGRSFGGQRGDRNERGGFSRGDRNERGSFSRGRSDRGRGGGNSSFNRGFDSFENQENTGFSSKEGFNDDNFRSGGRGGRGGSSGGGFGRRGGGNDSDGKRDFGRTGDSGGFGNFGKRGDNQESGGQWEFGRGGDSGGFGNFGRKGNNEESDGQREFGRGGGSGGFGNFGRKGNSEESGQREFGRGGDSGGFGNFGRKGNNEESGQREFGRGGGSGGFENRRGGGQRGGYKGRNEDVGFESGKGQDDLGKEDTGPRVTYVPPAPSDKEEDIFRHYQTGINFDKYDEILVDVSGVNAPPAILSFEDAALSDTLNKNIYKAGYVKLTPIQKHSIPIIMAGRDLMACAQTGSGKTAAFLLPILDHMMKNGVASSQFNDIQEPEAIIVAPTRELINQIYLDARKFAYGTIVRPVVIYGGTQTSHSLRQIFQGCNILCATPGRLLDVIGKEKIGLSKVKFLVLDEADRMLDMGFLGDIKKLFQSPGMPAKEERQTLMFSATFPEQIQGLARDNLKQNYLFVVVGQVGGACSDVEQQIIEVNRQEKRGKLVEILQNIGHERTMVFVNTKKCADFLATFLCQEHIPSTSIHGDREQREREKALGDFRSGQCPVIVATSVAARGLDIENVLHVINFDIPDNVDEYVHRIGRTGRCGNTGKAISFFDRTKDDDQKIARGLVKVLADAHQEVPAWLEEVAFSAHGTSSYSSHPSNFSSVDSRKRVGFQEDGNRSAGFSQPAAQAEDEDWG